MGLKEIYDLVGCAGVALILVGVLAAYITMWNLFYLYGVLKEFKSKFSGMENAGAERIKRAFGDSTNPLISIVRDMVTTHSAHSEDIRAEVAYLFHKNFKPVNNALTWLKLIAAVSPLLGLLGTVLGMVQVFQTIAQSASPDASQLASGIWIALITTVMGLVVAILALMAYYYLFLKVKELRIEAVEYSYRALESNKSIFPTVGKGHADETISCESSAREGSSCAASSSPAKEMVACATIGKSVHMKGQHYV